MTLEKHDLHHEFPEYEEQIRRLKMSDAHFSRFFDEYHDSDHEVHRIEQSAEYTSDEILEQKKMTRLRLKDQLLLMLKKASVSSVEE
ncbi:MAG: hypothetical protein ACJAWK_001924 [Candidatus Azotimanducaceae bacterium]|jgi:uncharacterized protein YdcH (DUF465 family)